MRPVIAGLLALGFAVAGCATPEPRSVPAAPVPDISSSISYGSVADQICRHYAQAQQALSADLMYGQCMYARGFLVAGFSPTPNTPGYQGPLPGPATIGGGN